MRRGEFIKDCKRKAKQKRKNTPSRPYVYPVPEPSTLPDPMDNELTDKPTSILDVLDYRARDRYFGGI